MSANNSITDLERAKFLEKLAADTRAHNGLLLSDFENEFLASYLSYHQYHRFFNAGNGGRRVVCDKLWMKYGREIGMNFPINHQDTKATKISEADPNGCQFLIYDGGAPHCCNEPATKMRQNGFRYCASHAEQVQRDLKRRGKTIHLLPFTKGKP